MRAGFRGIGREDEARGGVHHVLVFVPKKRPVVLQLGKIRLDHHHTRNHPIRNEGVIGAVVTVPDQLRGRPNRWFAGLRASGPSRPPPVEAQSNARRPPYFCGSGAVNGEQQGFPMAWNSMISARVPSGSSRLSCHLASRPTFGVLVCPLSRTPFHSSVYATSVFGTPSEK